MTKTRTYMKDGKVVTSTTTKLVVSGQENKVKEEHNIRWGHFAWFCPSWFNHPSASFYDPSLFLQFFALSATPAPICLSVQGRLLLSLPTPLTAIICPVLSSGSFCPAPPHLYPYVFLCLFEKHIIHICLSLPVHLVYHCMSSSLFPTAVCVCGGGGGGEYV